MNLHVPPIVKIITTTAVAWMLASAASAANAAGAATAAAANA